MLIGWPSLYNRAVSRRCYHPGEPPAFILHEFIFNLYISCAIETSHTQLVKTSELYSTEFSISQLENELSLWFLDKTRKRGHLSRDQPRQHVGLHLQGIRPLTMLARRHPPSFPRVIEVTERALRRQWLPGRCTRGLQDHIPSQRRPRQVRTLKAPLRGTNSPKLSTGTSVPARRRSRA